MSVVIDLVGCNPRAGNVVHFLHYYGNCLTGGEPGPKNSDFRWRVYNMDDIEDADNPEYLRDADMTDTHRAKDVSRDPRA